MAHAWWEGCADFTGGILTLPRGCAASAAMCFQEQCCLPGKLSNSPCPTSTGTQGPNSARFGRGAGSCSVLVPYRCYQLVHLRKGGENPVQEREKKAPA